MKTSSRFYGRSRRTLWLVSMCVVLLFGARVDAQLSGVSSEPRPIAPRGRLAQSELTAVDIYWATFAAMLRPLPHELCPMPEALRGQYGHLTPEIEAALDPALLEHRDRIYERHLELPLDF